jgi:hypothetical protein
VSRTLIDHEVEHCEPDAPDGHTVLAGVLKVVLGGNALDVRYDMSISDNGGDTWYIIRDSATGELVDVSSDDLAWFAERVDEIWIEERSPQNAN